MRVMKAGETVEPGATVVSLSPEDVEGIQLALEQARITWGGLGQGSLLRRISQQREVFSDILRSFDHDPASLAVEMNSGSPMLFPRAPFQNGQPARSKNVMCPDDGWHRGHNWTDDGTMLWCDGWTAPVVDA